MKNHLTPQQYQELQPFEQLLQTASKNNYSRSIPRPTLNTLYTIFKQITATQKAYNLSCSSCVKEILKTITEAYFNYIPETKKEQTQGNPQQTIQHEKDKKPKPNRKQTHKTSNP